MNISHRVYTGGLHVVVMGAAGCGKSTVGAALAERLGASFIDGDSLHPRSNIDKMASGTPLNDNDRAPWLAEIGRLFSERSSALVIACSALKRRYRDIIRNGDPSVMFVHLDGSLGLLTQRMNSRPGHFMPSSLLESQLAALEPLEAGEAGIVLSVDRPIEELVNAAHKYLPAAARNPLVTLDTKEEAR